MELYLKHQKDFVHIFSSIHRNTDLPVFMKRIQDLIVSLKTTIMLEKKKSIQACHFSILTLLYKLIPYTRDIYGGLGERNLSYAMIFIWKYHFPIPSAKAVQKMLLPIDKNPPYGSWRDIKHLCEFVKTHSEKGEGDPFIETCIGLMNHQLHEDENKWNESLEEFIRKQNTIVEISRPTPSDVGISLVCKWIPREHSAFHWLFKRCVIQWIRSFKPHYFKTCKTDAQFERAMKKGSKEYRRSFARLSTLWDTLEIKQCKHEWDKIRMDNVPMTAMRKQQQALLNIGQNGNPRKNTCKDIQRDTCSMKLKLHWLANTNHKRSNPKDVNPLFANMGDIIKTALRVSKPDEIKRSENEWNHVLSQVSNLEHFLPILDMSMFYSDKDAFYEALGIACLIAKKSSKRILMFDQTVHFVSVDYDNLQTILHNLRPLYYEHHIGQNFELVSHLLIENIKLSNMSSDDISKMKLVLLVRNKETVSMKRTIDTLFDKAGFDTSPFLFIWNSHPHAYFDGGHINDISGQCSISETILSKTFYISGSTNLLWSRISQISNDIWKKINAYDLIAFLLNQSRYNAFEDYFKTMLK